MGPFEFELYPSYEGVLLAPVIPQELFAIYPGLQEGLDGSNNAVVAGTGPLDSHEMASFDYFHLNQYVTNVFTIANDDTVAIPNIATQWTCTSQETSAPRLHLARFLLREDVANQLLDEYSQAPLLLPVQCVHYTNFNTEIGNQDNFSVTAQTTFRRANMGCILFRETSRSRQRFVNPSISYQLVIGGLTNPIPATHYNTIHDHRHTHLLLDACNVNNSKTLCIPDDVFSSINRYSIIKDYSATGALAKKLQWNVNETGKFLLAFPFSESGLFQSGLNLGNQTITLDGIRMKTNNKIPRINYPNPVYIGSSEKILILRTSKPEGGPQAEITDANYDELVGV